MSTQASRNSKRSKNKGHQKKHMATKVVINSLPFYATKSDIQKLLINYKVKIEKLEDIANPELNQLKGKRCIIDMLTKEAYEDVIQTRYIRAETLDKKPMFVETEPYERKRQPPPLLKRPDEEEFIGISQNVIFIESLVNVPSRKDFIRALCAWKITDFIDIFIFKVDKDGLATGSVRLLVKSDYQRDEVLKSIPQNYKGQKLEIYAYSDADKHFDFKLSKEIEMEKKKVQRKLKKLFKIPTTPKNETLKALLSELNKESQLDLTNKEKENNIRFNWKSVKKMIGRHQKRIHASYAKGDLCRSSGYSYNQPLYPAQMRNRVHPNNFHPGFAQINTDKL